MCRAMYLSDILTFFEKFKKVDCTKLGMPLFFFFLIDQPHFISIKKQKNSSNHHLSEGLRKGKKILGPWGDRTLDLQFTCKSVQDWRFSTKLKSLGMVQCGDCFALKKCHSPKTNMYCYFWNKRKKKPFSSFPLSPSLFLALYH